MPSMRVRSTETIARYMAAADCSQARLARHAKCSRQFINQLMKGRTSGCSEEIARRIENTLCVLPGTIFMPAESPASGSEVA